MNMLIEKLVFRNMAYSFFLPVYTFLNLSDQIPYNIRIPFYKSNFSETLLRLIYLYKRRLKAIHKIRI